MKFESTRRPYLDTLGRPRSLTVADKDALLEWLLHEPWRQQYEIVHWLKEERGVTTSQPTVLCVLKRNKWSRKEFQRISRDRSEQLRLRWRQDISRFIAEQLVFLDESIFNEKSGWRHMAYAPIGDEARYQTSIQRGKTWSICAAYTVNGYLPCTAIREGYFKKEDFLLWLTEELLSILTLSNRLYTICLDNVSIYIDSRVNEVVEAAGYLIRYLPPYSPDYNPIELSFSVLKAWIKRNYYWLRPTCESFGEFLRTAVELSGCDRFARKHFSKTELYIEEAKLEHIHEELRSYEAGEVDSLIED